MEITKSQDVRHKKTSYRAMTSLIVTWSFLVSTLTGLVLYLAPEGRIAYWTQWQLWQLTKDGWGDLHVIFSILFVAVGIAHLLYNWKPFKNYMAERASGHVHITRTLYGSLAISIVLFSLTLLYQPPANWVMDLSAYLKQSWVISPSYEPPFGHAEEVSFAGFTKRQQIDLDSALLALKAQNIQVSDNDMALKDIAALNETTPMAIYELIKPLQPIADILPVYTPSDVEAQFAGQGIGRKSLGEMATILQMDIDNAVSRLAKRHIGATAENTLKEIAEAQGIELLELIKVLLIDGYEPKID